MYKTRPTGHSFMNQAMKIIFKKSPKKKKNSHKLNKKKLTHKTKKKKNRQNVKKKKFLLITQDTLGILVRY